MILRTTRLVSFVQRAVAAIEYEVETYGGPARIVVQSELIANEPVPETTNDPRAAAALRKPLQGEFNGHHKLRAGLVHITRASKLRVAAGMDHVVERPAGGRHRRREREGPRARDVRHRPRSGRVRCGS